MERALFLRHPDTPLEGFTRLYFGAEFCPWALPGAGEIRGALELARSAGLCFTLATPVLTEPFLAPFAELLDRVLPLLIDGDEVLVSDLGAIALVRDRAPSCTLVVGRALSGQKRGPQVLNLELNNSQRDYFRSGSWYSAEARALLAEVGIARVELDSLLQGVAPLPAGLAGSLHHPFAMVTSSGTCPFRSHGSSGPCSRPCGEAFVLETPEHPVPLFQAGNTQFLRQEELPPDPASLGLDRLVFHPVLPR